MVDVLLVVVEDLVLFLGEVVLLERNDELVGRLRRCLDLVILSVVDTLGEDELVVPLFGLLLGPRVEARGLCCVFWAEDELVEPVDCLALVS